MQYEKKLLEISGKEKADEVSDTDQAKLEQAYPELAELRGKALEYMKQQGYNERATEFWNSREQYQAERIAKLEAGAKAWQGGSIAGRDYRKLIQDTGLELGAKYSVLEKQYSDVVAEFQKPEEMKHPEDKAYAFYWDIMFSPEFIDEMGVPKYRERDQALAGLQRQFTTEVWAKAMERITWGREDYPPEVQLYYKAQETLKPYWAIQDTVLSQLGVPEDLYQKYQQATGVDKRKLLMQNPRMRIAAAKITQARQAMRRQNPEVEKYLRLFYS